MVDKTLIIILATAQVIVLIAYAIIVFKAVQLGLKWNIQMKQDKEPELKNPIAEAVKEHKQEKQAEMSQSIYNEWINGGAE